MISIFISSMILILKLLGYIKLSWVFIIVIEFIMLIMLILEIIIVYYLITKYTK